MNLLERLEEICICKPGGPTVRGCPQHAPEYGQPMPVATPESIHAMLIRIINNQEKFMSQMDGLNSALAQEGTDITSLATTLNTVWTDLKTALDNNDVAAATAVVQQHDASIQQFISAAQTNDPNTANAGAGAGTGASNAGGTTTVNTDPGASTTGTTGTVTDGSTGLSGQ